MITPAKKPLHTFGGQCSRVCETCYNTYKETVAYFLCEVYLMLRDITTLTWKLVQTFGSQRI